MDSAVTHLARKLQKLIPVGISPAIALIQKEGSSLENIAENWKKAQILRLAEESALPVKEAREVLEKFQFDRKKSIDFIENQAQSATEKILHRDATPTHKLKAIYSSVAAQYGISPLTPANSEAELAKIASVPVQKFVLVYGWMTYWDFEGLEAGLQWPSLEEICRIIADDLHLQEWTRHIQYCRQLQLKIGTKLYGNPEFTHIATLVEQESDEVYLHLLKWVRTHLRAFP